MKRNFLFSIISGKSSSQRSTVPLFNEAEDLPRPQGIQESPGNNHFYLKNFNSSESKKISLPRTVFYILQPLFYRKEKWSESRRLRKCYGIWKFLCERITLSKLHKVDFSFFQITVDQFDYMLIFITC